MGGLLPLLLYIITFEQTPMLQCKKLVKVNWNFSIVNLKITESNSWLFSKDFVRLLRLEMYFGISQYEDSLVLFPNFVNCSYFLSFSNVTVLIWNFRFPMQSRFQKCMTAAFSIHHLFSTPKKQFSVFQFSRLQHSQNTNFSFSGHGCRVLWPL